MRARSFAFAAAAATLVLVAAPVAAQEEPPAATPEPAPPPPAAPKTKPSIIVSARDSAGQELRSVTVFIDDQAVAYELTGQPITLEPGPHAIAVQRNDGPRERLTQMLTFAEGDTNHGILFPFPKPTEPPSMLEEPVNAPIAPRIIAGVGVAGMITGVVLLLARPTMPTNCDSDPAKCTKLSAQTDAQFAQDRDDAGKNRGFLNAGLVTLISGAALTAGGILWYVLDRKGAPKEAYKTTKPRTVAQDALLRRTALAPWLDRDGGGVVLRSSF